MAHKIKHDGVRIPPHECAQILKHVCFNEHNTVSFRHCQPEAPPARFCPLKAQRTINVVIDKEITMFNESWTDPTDVIQTNVICDKYWILVMKLLCDLNSPLIKMMFNNNDVLKLLLITVALIKYSNMYDINCLLLRTLYDKRYFGESFNIYVLENDSKLVLLRNVFCGTRIYNNKNHIHEPKIEILMTQIKYYDPLIYKSSEKLILKVENNLMTDADQPYYVIGEANHNIEENIVYVLFINLYADDFSRIIYDNDLKRIKMSQQQMYNRLTHYFK